MTDQDDSLPSREYGWFANMSLDAQAAILADPRGPIPAEFVGEVLGAGTMAATAAWFPAAQSGPDGFHIEAQVASAIEHARDGVQRWFDALDEHTRSAFVDSRGTGIPAEHQPAAPDTGIIASVQDQSLSLTALPFDVVSAVVRAFLELKAREVAGSDGASE